ncbi:MAG: aminotransferase class III-fold pyridoxal phosphate-dependent enzyme, partial [Deltaproteobacteria bacterium]
AAAMAAESVIHGRRDEIAAVVIEPLVQGAAGMIMHPPGYLKRVARACKENGVLLICDEVATGFGRTGTLFACEQEEVVPDFLCVAKGLSGGYLPLAATLTTDAVYESFLGPYESRRTFFHGHSRMMAERLAEGLQSVAELKHVGDVRQRGLMIGIELVKDKKTKEEFPYEARMGHRVTLAARRRELMLRPLGNVVVLMPPLAIVGAEVDFLVESVRESIREATELM